MSVLIKRGRKKKTRKEKKKEKRIIVTYAINCPIGTGTKIFSM